MDDLDAVLASLEHTETALRTQPVHAPDVQTQTTTTDAELDADFAAELDALSASTPSESLLFAGPVHYLGAKHSDWVEDANSMTENLRKFILEVEKCQMQVNSGGEESHDKTIQQENEVSKKYKVLYNEVEELIKVWNTLNKAEKGYFNVSSAKSNLVQKRKELSKEYEKLQYDFNRKFPPVADKKENTEPRPYTNYEFLHWSKPYSEKNNEIELEIKKYTDEISLVKIWVNAINSTSIDLTKIARQKRVLNDIKPKLEHACDTIIETCKHVIDHMTFNRIIDETGVPGLPKKSDYTDTTIEKWKKTSNAYESRIKDISQQIETLLTKLTAAEEKFKSEITEDSPAATNAQPASGHAPQELIPEEKKDFSEKQMAKIEEILNPFRNEKKTAEMIEEEFRKHFEEFKSSYRKKGEISSAFCQTIQLQYELTIKTTKRAQELLKAITIDNFSDSEFTEIEKKLIIKKIDKESQEIQMNLQELDTKFAEVRQYMDRVEYDKQKGKGETSDTIPKKIRHEISLIKLSIDIFNAKAEEAEKFLVSVNAFEQKNEFKMEEPNTIHKQLCSLEEELRKCILDVGWKKTNLSADVSRNYNANEELKEIIKKMDQDYSECSERETKIRHTIWSKKIMLAKRCTHEYITQYETEQNAKHKSHTYVAIDTRREQPTFTTHVSPFIISHAHTTSHTFTTSETFTTELTRFAQDLRDLVHPPTPAPAWSVAGSGPSPKPRAPQHTHTNTHTNTHANTHANKQLVFLAARVAHITAVADRYPHLAALRVALELAPNSVLVSHALAASQTGLADKNAQAVRACLTSSRFKRLYNIADTQVRYAKAPAPVSSTAEHHDDWTHDFEAERHELETDEKRYTRELTGSRKHKKKSTARVPKLKFEKDASSHHHHEHTHSHTKEKHDQQNQNKQERHKNKKKDQSWLSSFVPSFLKSSDEFVEAHTPRQQDTTDRDVSGTSV